VGAIADAQRRAEYQVLRCAQEIGAVDARAMLGERARILELLKHAGGPIPVANLIMADRALRGRLAGLQEAAIQRHCEALRDAGLVDMECHQGHWHVMLETGPISDAGKPET
jgi:DNA-binding transcriptional ArsR family regulator